jgi:hypothetical protein
VTSSVGAPIFDISFDLLPRPLSTVGARPISAALIVWEETWKVIGVKEEPSINRKDEPSINRSADYFSVPALHSLACR